MNSVEFRLAYDAANDDPALAEAEAPDVFTAFRADAELAAALGGRSAHQHVSNFREETSVLDSSLAAHYKKLAGEAERKTPPPASYELRKRFGGSEKTLFRKFFAEQRSLGKTVAQILDRFTDEARVEFADVLRELCQEFEQAA